MKSLCNIGVIVVVIFLGNFEEAHGQVSLFDIGVNINGTTTYASVLGPGIPPYDLSDQGVDGLFDADFDYDYGLGVIHVGLDTPGSHFVGLFVDHDIEESLNSFFNEFGLAAVLPLAGQSWEIDEPEAIFGDILTNFENSNPSAGSALDNFNNVPPSFEEDVSLALGHQFDLAPGEIALVSFGIGPVAPSGFHLVHVDPDSDIALYFQSTLNIAAAPVPEPSSSFALLLVTLIGFAHRRRPKAV